MVAERIVEVQGRLSRRPQLERPFAGNAPLLKVAAPFAQAPRRDPEREVRMTGPGVPTASHPADPWVTLVRAASPVMPDTCDKEVTRDHGPPTA